MKIKNILTIIITIFIFQFANAQPQGERVSTTEIIRLVSDAQAKHNTIYNELIKGHEDERSDLRKAVYSANTELMAIRSMLAGNQMLKRADYAKLEKPLTELTTAIQAVEQSTMDGELSRTISNVTTKAKKVKKMIQKIKKK